MQVAITGASGMVGTALTESLVGSGHRVLKLVRRAPVAADEAQWSPADHEIDLARLDGLDAIVHLAGESINSGRWTANVKHRIQQSRIDGTRTLASAVNRLSNPPQVVVSASAVGYYGDRGDEVLDESSPPGSGFLAETVRAWEGEIDRIEPGRSRVVKLRFGVILARHSGALPLMRLPFQFGVGGTIAGGRQWLAWVTLDDAVRAIRFALEAESLTGPVNVVAPNPVRNAEFTRALADAMHRPAPIPVPALPLKLLFGEMANDLLIASQRVVPKLLERQRFRFAHPDIRRALAAVLDRGQTPLPAAG